MGDEEDTQYKVSAASIEAQERDAALRAQLELKKLERTVAVPTNEAEVKRMLRELGEPITLFAETVCRVAAFSDLSASCSS